MNTTTLKTGGLLAALLLTSAPVLARELVRDGNVGALLHIEPDDEPMVGMDNRTWIETNQRGGKPVNLTNCTCALSVYQGSIKPGVMGGNVSESARQLGVHRQSLLHRLERLQGALGWDLSNPEDRFTLELAVRLRRIAHPASSER